MIRRVLLPNLAALLVVAPFAFVFVFMIWNSFKPDYLFFEPGVWWFEPTLMHYRDVFGRSHIGENLKNSLVVSTLATAIGVTAGLMTAWTIARFDLRRLAYIILLTRMVPYVTMLIPLWLVFQTLGLINSHAGMVIAHLLITVPFGVWVLIAYIEDIPKDLEHAAQMDGASRVQAFRHVVLPLARPGVLATAVLCFIFSWNNFQLALVLGGIDVKTAPVAVFQFSSADTGSMGAMLAAATLVTLPGLLVVALAQKQLSSGLTTGGLK